MFCRNDISDDIWSVMKQRTRDELLLIANNFTGDYSDKDVRRAKKELYNRGETSKVVEDIMEEEEAAFMKRLDAAARAEAARMDILNEKNRNISYAFWELALIFLLSPFILVHTMRSFEFAPELRRLKKEKYDLKFKQRLTLLIIGNLLFWFYTYYSVFIKPRF